MQDATITDNNANTELFGIEAGCIDTYCFSSVGFQPNLCLFWFCFQKKMTIYGPTLSLSPLILIVLRTMDTVR